MVPICADRNVLTDTFDRVLFLLEFDFESGAAGLGWGGLGWRWGWGRAGAGAGAGLNQAAVSAGLSRVGSG